MKKCLSYCLLTAVLTLSGCGLPYRIDVDQGNIITANDIAKLQVGMSKDDVRLVLGDPLLNDVFHKDRWDYVQYYKHGKTQKQQKGVVSLYFTNGLLSSVNNKRMTELDRQPVDYSR